MNAAPIAAALAAVLAGACATAQGSVRAPGTATCGGSITVEVGGNDTTVEVSATGSSDVQSHDIGADRTATFPVPDVAPGTILIITVGRGLRARTVLVEVLRP
jgi:hypothetical protein